MGIKLKMADIDAVKRDASVCCPAKPHYKNGHLPFENAAHDLPTWHDAILLAIIDCARTLEEPFIVNSHPDLHSVVEANWNEEFPEIPANEAVQGVVHQRICVDSRFMAHIYPSPAR